MSVGVVIAAAGSGRRMGSHTNKVFLDVEGKPILAHSLEVFASCEFIRQIVVVTRDEDVQAVNRIIAELGLTDIASACVGGQVRQESVYSGLQALDSGTDWVMIHDAARPYITKELVEGALLDCHKHKAVGVGMPVKDTVKIVKDGFVVDTPDRSNLWIMQTPQVFSYALILQAHEKARQEGFVATDDCMLVERMGVPVYIREGSYENIKITTPEDLPTRANGERNVVGIGFDVHKLVPERKLILCGVQIPWEKGLLGHSDADVAAHAVMDALLGASGLGDIGELFPDSDELYKDVSSMQLLRTVISRLTDRGLSVGNIDLTIIAERPKLAPWKEQMRANIASVVGVPVGRISIKATTTEGLGFTGRGEGIAAQAVVMLATNHMPAIAVPRKDES